MKKNKSGKMGEDAVTSYLRWRLHRILARNFYSRYGEIDIIATTRKYIIFVEVKTRGENSLARPVEAVTKEKQRKLRLTAKYYLLLHQTDLQPRFDVAEVFMEHERIVNINYIKNAF